MTDALGHLACVSPSPLYENHAVPLLGSCVNSLRAHPFIKLYSQFYFFSSLDIFVEPKICPPALPLSWYASASLFQVFPMSSSSMLTRPCVIRINLNWTLCPGATWAIVVNNNGTRVWSNARQTKVRPGKQRGRWCSRAAASDTYWSSPPASAWDLRCAGRPSRAAWSALTHRRLFGPRVPATPMTSPHTLPQWSLLCKNMYEIKEWYIWKITIQCVWCTNIPMKQNKNVAGYKMKLKYGVRQKVNWYIDSRMEWNKMKVNTARCNNFT